MLISGHIENSEIVIDENIKLPDGVKVSIFIEDCNIPNTYRVCRDSKKKTYVNIRDIISEKGL